MLFPRFTGRGGLSIRQKKKRLHRKMTQINVVPEGWFWYSNKRLWWGSKRAPLACLELIMNPGHLTLCSGSWLSQKVKEKKKSVCLLIEVRLRLPVLSPSCVSGTMLNMRGNELMSKTLDSCRHEGKGHLRQEKEAPQSPSIVKPH